MPNRSEHALQRLRKMPSDAACPGSVGRGRCYTDGEQEPSLVVDAGGQLPAIGSSRQGRDPSQPFADKLESLPLGEAQSFHRGLQPPDADRGAAGRSPRARSRSRRQSPRENQCPGAWLVRSSARRCSRRRGQGPSSLIEVWPGAQAGLWPARVRQSAARALPASCWADGRSGLLCPGPAVASPPSQPVESRPAATTRLQLRPAVAQAQRHRR